MERVCFTLQVRPDRLDDYRVAHQQVWPAMLDALRETGWRNYSLFLREDGLLIGYVECEDFQASLVAMAETEVNGRWQAAMSEYFADLDGRRADEGMRPLAEVFHLD
jgi:L-rhamnose mutarotase